MDAWGRLVLFDMGSPSLSASWCNHPEIKGCNVMVTVEPCRVTTTVNLIVRHTCSKPYNIYIINVMMIMVVVMMMMMMMMVVMMMVVVTKMTIHKYFEGLNFNTR